MNLTKIDYAWKESLPAVYEQTVCQCCGSQLTPNCFRASINPGITIIIGDVAMEKETYEYWINSIPIGNEFLVIKHRKLTATDEEE